MLTSILAKILTSGPLLLLTLITEDECICEFHVRFPVIWFKALFKAYPATITDLRAMGGVSQISCKMLS